MNWLDLEMGADMTGFIEFGHQERPGRMTMSQGEQLMLPMLEKAPLRLPPPKKEDEEEKVNGTCSEKTED